MYVWTQATASWCLAEVVGWAGSPSDDAPERLTIGGADGGPPSPTAQLTVAPLN
jgi:hypothetical protein